MYILYHVIYYTIYFMYKVCTFFISYPKEYRKSMNNGYYNHDNILSNKIVSYYSIIIEKYILFIIFFYFVLFLLFYE